MRKKEKGWLRDTWVSIISSSSLLSHVRALPAGASRRSAGARSSAYTLASDPPPQTYPWQSRVEGEMGRGVKAVGRAVWKQEQIEGWEGKKKWVEGRGENKWSVKSVEEEKRDDENKEGCRNKYGKRDSVIRERWTRAELKKQTNSAV